MDQRGFLGAQSSHPDSPITGTDHFEFCYHSFPYLDHQHSREAMFFQPLASGFAGGIESYLDPKYISDPAAFASRLPFLPFSNAYAMYEWGFEPAFIRKRNERERQRVKCVNEGYARLREHLPQEFAEKRLSKVETLRGAIQYIKQLQRILGIETELDEKRKNEILKSSSDSEQDKTIDDNCCKYTSNDTEQTSIASLSSKDERLSICSGESEDVVSNLSPKIKVEISSPEKSLCESNEPNFCDYMLKGRIFCKTTPSSLFDQVSGEKYDGCASSCCWVGKQNNRHDSFLSCFPEYTSDGKSIVNERKQEHLKQFGNYDLSLNSAINQDNSNFDNANSCSVNAQLNRKRSSCELTRRSQNETENIRWRHKMAKRFCLERAENEFSYNRETDSEGVKSDCSPPSANASPPI